MVEAQWTQIEGTTNFELCGVHSTIPGIIFERNLMTVNGGEDWLNTYPAPLSSIHGHPDSPDTLFFVGDTLRSETDHPFYRSVDGGQTWEFLGTSPTWLFPEFSYITDMEIVSGVIHASMNNGGYTYSGDWGNTWISHNNLFSPSNFEIEVDTSTTPPTIYLGSRAFGDVGKVERSLDAGQTWETILGDIEQVDVLDLKLDPTNPSILYVSCVDIWGWQALVYRLTNDGQKEIIFESEEPAGDRSNIWINQEHPSWLYLAVGCQQVIYVSRDSGETWSDLLWNLEFEPDFQFVDNANLYLSQPNYLVVSTQINGTRYLYQLTDTGQEDVATSVVQPEFILFQNYPNPFNPQTTIDFTLPMPTQVNLVVYNLQGVRITLETGYCTAGHHTVVFDGTNLSSGVYFYTLQTEKSTITRKMLLVK